MNRKYFCVFGHHYDVIDKTTMRSINTHSYSSAALAYAEMFSVPIQPSIIIYTLDIPNIAVKYRVSWVEGQRNLVLKNRMIIDMNPELKKHVMDRQDIFSLVNQPRDHVVQVCITDTDGVTRRFPSVLRVTYTSSKNTLKKLSLVDLPDLPNFSEKSVDEDGQLIDNSLEDSIYLTSYVYDTE